LEHLVDQERMMFHGAPCLVSDDHTRRISFRGRSPRIPATVLEYFKIAEMTWIQDILVDFSHAVVDRANDLHEGQGITR